MNKQDRVWLIVRARSLRLQRMEAYLAKTFQGPGNRNPSRDHDQDQESASDDGSYAAMAIA